MDSGYWRKFWTSRASRRAVLRSGVLAGAALPLPPWQQPAAAAALVPMRRPQAGQQGGRLCRRMPRR